MTAVHGTRAFAVPSDGSSADVWFHEIGRSQWRVLDSALPMEDVRSLVGFVEDVDGGFELTCLGEPGRLTRFDTLDDVHEAFLVGTVAAR